MAASAVIVKSAIAHRASIIGMAGTGQVFQFGVIFGAGVRIADNGAQRRACSFAVKYAGKNLRLVRLLPGRSQGAFPRSATLQFRADKIQIHLHTGRHAFQHYADGRPMAFAENRIGHITPPA